MCFDRSTTISVKTLAAAIQLVLLGVPAAFAQDADQSAQIKERVTPQYPRSQARKGQEGWVQLSYVIDEQGQVIDPFIIDSSGIEGFEKSALNAVSKWQFAPAMQNGKPVQQCENKLQLDFKLDNAPKGGTRKFVKLMRRFNDYLTANKLEQAQATLDELEDIPRWNYYEAAFFDLAKSNYARATGQPEEQLNYLSNALISKGEYLPKKIYAAGLQERFILEIQQNKLMDALDTFDVMQNSESELNSEVVNSVQQAAQKIHDFIDSDNPIAVSATIGQRGYWRHTLSRKAFSFVDINGKIDDMDIRCDKHRNKFDVKRDKMWNIPLQWGECNVFVRGEQGARFKLVELTGEQQTTTL
ncbi:energy transducer TonB [Neptunicella sp. SCSIO 80796]|uniref:energy transducer TonB n=1 Tax=Neptunicella plasticusilytica TaxID=3117012 RepID=UPI003A4D5C1A